jgi:hypothetical protein
MPRSCTPGIRHLCLALLLSSLTGQAARAGLSVKIDGVTIEDNGAMDLDPTPNIIRFDSRDAMKGFQNMVNSGYNVAGEVRALIDQKKLVLVNFIADRPAGAAGGELKVSFQSDGYPGGEKIEAYDTINPFVSNGTGADPYLTDADKALAVPAGTDKLVNWQGYVNGNAIGKPVGPKLPQGNPNFPAKIGVSKPYDGDDMGRQVGHGPVEYDNPGANLTLRGDLTITLGADRDQFSVFPDAVVGYSVVPCPPSLAMACIGGLAGLGAWWRRR